MKYFFCLLTAEEGKNGLNIGRTFAYNNRSRWIQCDAVSQYITVGFNIGTDCIVHDNKAYRLLKSYTNIDTKEIVLIAVEDTTGCNI